MISIRHATIDDLEALTEIYNEAILTTTATFDMEPKTVDDRRAWFAAHGPRLPVLVAEEDGTVCGYACLTRWSERKAYDGTAETSFYVKSGFQGRGIGRALKGAIIQAAVDLGYHTLLARVADGSDASLHLNREFGFELLGTMKEVGFKFGRRIDVHLLQLMLRADQKSPTTSPP
jgi:L-amino acid N-acyltransferase